MAPLQPLQQTTFEQGPQVGSVPTEVPAFMYQEGQVILPDPINPAAALDPGVNWYGLGAETMKIAQDMVTETWDYLIQTKQNGLIDLGDKYQSKLDNAYMRLSALQSEAQKRGGPSANHNLLIDGLVEQIKKVKTEWKTEANKVLGIGEEPTIFDPKLDAFNTDISNLGLKYQRLAVTAQRSNRDIDNTAEKLLFQAQLARIGAAKQNFDVRKAKDGNGDFPDNADRVSSGMVYLNMTGDELRASDMFYNEDGTVKTDNAGLPLITEDTEGNVLINPDANKDVWSRQEFDYIFGYSQAMPDSAVVDKNGIPNKEVTQNIVNFLNTDTENRNANTAWQIGRIFSLSSPSAVATFAARNKLSAADTATLGTLRALVATGGASAESLQRPLEWLNKDQLEQASRFITTLSTPQLGSGTERTIPGTDADETLRIINNVLLPAYASGLGLQGEEAVKFMANYKVEGRSVRGFTTIEDANRDEFIFTQLMEKNPQLAYLGMAAVAFYAGNKNLFGTTEGGSFKEDTAKMEEAMKQFTTVLTSQTGMIPLKNDSGLPVSVWNPRLIELTPIMSKFGTQKTAKAFLSSDLSRKSVREAAPIVTRMFPGTDSDLYSTVAESMVSVQTNINGERVAKHLPFGEHARIALASNPNFWIAMGWKDSTGKPINSIEQANALSFDEKLNLVSISAQQLAPAHEWDMDLTINPRDYAFAQSEEGGLPIRFLNIKDSQGRPIINRRTNQNIFDVLVPKQSVVNDTYTPRDGQGNALIAIPSRLTSIQPGKSVASILQDSAEEIDNEKVPYTLAWGDNRPSSGPISTSVAIEKAIAPDPNTELVQRLNESFPTSPNSPLIETDADLMNLVNIHGAAISSLLELDPVLQDVVQYFDSDFAKINQGEAQFFTPEVLQQVVAKGKELGLKTNGEYMGLVLSTIAFKQENKAPTEDWGLRTDGVTPKGPGWLGIFYTKSGQPVTEYSIGVEINGEPMEIPTLVPGLTADEIEKVVAAAEQGEQVPDSVVQKATLFARNQLNKGKPVFKEALTQSQKEQLAKLATALQVGFNKKNQKAMLKEWEVRREKINKDLEEKQLREWRKQPWNTRLRKSITDMGDSYYFGSLPTPISAATWWAKEGIAVTEDFKNYLQKTKQGIERSARDYEAMREAAYKERGLPVPGPYDRGAYGAGLAIREMIDSAAEQAAIDLQTATPQETERQLKQLDATQKGARAGVAVRSMAYDYLYGPNNTVRAKQEEAKRMLEMLEALQKDRTAARAGVAFRSLLNSAVNPESK